MLEQTSETAIGAAFKRAGLKTEHLSAVESNFINIACRTLFHTGVSVERAHELVDIAARLYVGEPRGRVFPPEFTPAPTPSAPMPPERKAARKRLADEAAAIYAETIAGRQLGSILVGELDSIIEEGTFTMRFAAKVKKECKGKPASMALRHAIDAATLRKHWNDAKR